MKKYYTLLSALTFGSLITPAEALPPHPTLSMSKQEIMKKETWAFEDSTFGDTSTDAPAQFYRFTGILLSRLCWVVYNFQEDNRLARVQYVFPMLRFSEKSDEQDAKGLIMALRFLLISNHETYAFNKGNKTYFVISDKNLCIQVEYKKTLYAGLGPVYTSENAVVIEFFHYYDRKKTQKLSDKLHSGMKEIFGDIIKPAEDFPAPPSTLPPDPSKLERTKPPKTKGP